MVLPRLSSSDKSEALKDAAECFPWKPASNHCLTCYYATEIAHRLQAAIADNFWISLNGNIFMDVLEASNSVKMFREQQQTCVTTLPPISRFHELFLFPHILIGWVSSSQLLWPFLFAVLFSENIHIMAGFHNFYVSLIYSQPIKDPAWWSITPALCQWGSTVLKKAGTSQIE